MSGLGRLPELTVDELDELEAALMARVHNLEARLPGLRGSVGTCQSLLTAIREAKMTAERTATG